MAFVFDFLIIFVFSLLVYLLFVEIRADATGEPGLMDQISQALKDGENVSLKLRHDDTSDGATKSRLLKILEERIGTEDLKAAKKMSAEEIYHEFEAEFIAADYRHRFIYLGEAFNLFMEYVVSILYFVLFFRFGGRTLGKRIFRLKVIDLDGKPRLGWYQSFERAHGYVCSGLFASLGFWQVLWNKKGLTMHDKIAETTVIKLPKKKRPRRKKQLRYKAKKPAQDSAN